MAKKKATRKKATRKKAPARRKPAGRKKAASRKKTAPADMLISKARTKNLASLNVASDFYIALDAKVRELIAGAEARAEANNRRTLRPQDL